MFSVFYLQDICYILRGYFIIKWYWIIILEIHNLNKNLYHHSHMWGRWREEWLLVEKNFYLRTQEWKWKLLSIVQLFVTLWTVVRGILQARILEWIPSPGDLPNQGIELRSPTSQVDSLLAEPQRKPESLRLNNYYDIVYFEKPPSFSTEIHRDFRTLYSKP